MSKRLNRAKLSSAELSRIYQIIKMNYEYPPYWDEGLNFYPRFHRGFKNSNKQIHWSKVRESRTWKHNRKYQWK